MTITIDKTDPETAKMLAGCKVGDKYSIPTATVTADSPETLTLEADSIEKGGVEDENMEPELDSEAEPEAEPSRSPVALVIAKKYGKK